jgi:DNA-binding transcriptional ArsR family regulator
MSTGFTDVFGDTPQVRLLDFLAGNLEFDYTISQLSASANLSRPTVYGLVERLTRDGLLVHTRTVGRSRFYRINRGNPVILNLLRLDFAEARAAGEAAYEAWRRSRARAGRRKRVPRG